MNDKHPGRQDPLGPLFAALGRSSFRSRFHLAEKDRRYVADRGLDTIAQHARDILQKRLAPAAPAKDGKQTPYRGHPVFVAQHATATCCRSCVQKWHLIPKGRDLTALEIERLVAVIRTWVANEMAAGPGPDRHSSVHPDPLRGLMADERQQDLEDNEEYDR